MSGIKSQNEECMGDLLNFQNLMRYRFNLYVRFVSPEEMRNRKQEAPEAHGFPQSLASEPLSPVYAA